MWGHNNKKGIIYSKNSKNKHIIECRLPLPLIHCTSQWTLIFQQYLLLSNCKQSPSPQPACQLTDIQIHHPQPLCRQSVHCLYHCKYSEKQGSLKSLTLSSIYTHFKALKKKALGKHCLLKISTKLCHVVTLNQPIKSWTCPNRMHLQTKSHM